ncbi:MAG: biotin transporter BioY [Microbacteriaceae bacterium]
MSSLTLTWGRPTLADRLFARTAVMQVLLVFAGAALTALAAQLTIPMFPVPMTGQTFAVLLVGTTLGAVRGGLALLVYLLMGVFGLPVFAGGAHGSLLNSASGGYIVGFVFAAALTGWLAGRQWDRKVVGTLVTFASGTVVIYLVGLPWLYAVLSGLPTATLSAMFGTTSLLQATIVGGLLPFLIGDTVKAVVAAGLLPSTWKLIDRSDRRKAQPRD